MRTPLIKFRYAMRNAGIGAPSSVKAGAVPTQAAQGGAAANVAAPAVNKTPAATKTPTRSSMRVERRAMAPRRPLSEIEMEVIMMDWLISGSAVLRADRLHAKKMSDGQGN
ncbi:hypothetical protein FVE85_6819 [Porphyridium purpureum]|uniref:Uncharacterized protein n=1 Tax=Porphyridium purpureum TaxID=35688 RepID=A0A5J4Z889_PORPP|nr:hypothetical protein FVE85_6819 [Porphyridium purpureum]|eukprot:POR9757..scf295_1